MAPGLLTLVGGIIGGVIKLVASLTQQQTNGNSVWGTLTAPNFPLFLTNNPLIDGFPWGSLSQSNANPYTQYPTTNVVRKYDFTITRQTIAPDGYEVSTLLVNGAFPGPMIEANWGDIIQVTVNNQITGPGEGTTLHWHGFLQKGTNYADGIPGVGQCPIAPGSSFTYTFQAQLYGTTWYHSHYSGQYSGGVFGPMIIHGPNENANYDIDLGPVFLNDWYHEPYLQVVDTVMKPLSQGGNPKPASDNNLINGKMNFNCSTVAPGDTTECTNNAGLSKFKFTTGKTHRLRLINSGAEGLERFSIDGHTMTVIANDFVPVKPYTTEVVTLGIGQRTDVLVTANQKPGAYWMRSNISTICSDANQPFALAAIYYSNVDTTTAPNSTAWNVPDPGTCANDPLSETVPEYSMAVATPSYTQTMEISYYINSTDSFLWTLAGTSFRADYNAPLLQQVKNGNLTFDPISNVFNYGTNTTVRIIVQNNSPASHPMHLHGHNMQILAEGPGTWDGTITNPSNPQRRDVQMVRVNGYFVMQYSLDNPGMWPFHCHIAWHLSGGLYANMLESPRQIETEGALSIVIPEVCNSWNAWTNRNVPDQLDSGEK